MSVRKSPSFDILASQSDSVTFVQKRNESQRAASRDQGRSNRQATKEGKKEEEDRTRKEEKKWSNERPPRAGGKNTDKRKADSRTPFLV